STVRLRRASGSSSTTSACIGGSRFSGAGISLLLEWQGDQHFNSAWSDAPKLYLGPLCVHDLQARTQVAEADTGMSHLPIGREMRPIIVNTQAQAVGVPRSDNANGPSGNTLGDAVLDGIFHQRLQQEGGDLRAQQFGWNVHADLEPFSKP